jgi:hypothetical protein
MFVNDEALLDVSCTAAQARPATSCRFSCVRTCGRIRVHRHAGGLRASTVIPGMLQAVAVAGQAGMAQPGALLLPGVPGLRASPVAGHGRLRRSGTPDSGRPCAVELPACPGAG